MIRTRKASARFLSAMLCLVMMLTLMPTTALAEDTRVKITKVTASLEENPIYYGRDAKDYPKVTYDSDQGIVIRADMVYFQEYVDGNWRTLNDGAITEGKWRIGMQVRTGGTETVLDPNVILTVNGVEWERANNYSVGDTFSYVSFYSPEFTVTKPTGGELSFSTGSTIIPKTYTGQPMAEIDLSTFVSGGIEPYTFTKVSGPEWISVSATGKVTGTPTAEGANDDLVVKVTDALGTAKSATINVKETILDFSARVKITAVTASLEENPIYYGRDAKDYPKVTYDSDQGIVIRADMVYFQEYVDGNWRTLNDGAITEGKWRIGMQVRTGGTETVLDPNVILTVNGVEWERANNYSVGDTFSYVSFYSPEFTVTAPPTLEGTATLSSAYYASPVNPNTTGLPSTSLSYQWQRSNNGTGGWANISGATKRSYTPGEDDVGKYIRLVIKADGYTSSVISNAVEVKQALINFEKPVMPTLSYDGTNGLVVTNAKANQEYLVTYNSNTPSDWSSAKKPSADGSLALSASQNTTVYVHTRVAETTYKPAGMYTDYNSIYTGTPTSLVDFSINYSKLSLKVGEVVKLTATPIPAGATGWTGVQWYSNDASAKLYKDEACTQEYSRSTDGFAKSVYIKGISQKNWFTVGGEKTIGGIPTSRLITVAVTDTEGNYVLERLAFPDVTLAPGESVIVDIASYPNPSKVLGTMTFVANAANPASTLVLTPLENNTKLKIEVPAGANLGGYGYNVKLDGSPITTNVWTVTVAEKGIPVDAVTVVPSTTTMAPGTSMTPTAVVSPSNHTETGSVMWSKVSGSDSITIDPATGKVTVSGSAVDGDTATIRATFGGKYGECVITVSIVQYGVTVTNGMAYIGAGTMITKAVEGTEVILIANAAPSGKVFDKWVVESGDITLADASSATTTFTMPADAVSVKATYKDKPVTTYNLTTQVNGGHGTISASKTGLTEGSTETVIFTPDDGYEIDIVTVNGVETGVLSNVLNVTMDADKTVIVTYKVISTVPTAPSITTVTLPDGKVGDAYNQTLAATGTNPITWGIEAGTLPDGLTLVGDTIKGTPSKAGDFKFTVKATNGGGFDTKELTIKVADAEAAKYHNVTLTGAGTGATGAGSHAAGTTVNIYAGTKSGYTFNGWTSDDVTVLSASSKNASFVMPDNDVTVKANWVYNGGGSSGGYTYYTIKATAGVNGSISPTGNVSVREGRDQTFTITPDKGYAVAKVLIDSKNVGAVKSYTFENVKKNHTIEVVFMKASGNPQTGVFVDVPEGSYYEEAVNWAVEKGITTGTDATHFSPDGICTRAQAATFLWRAAGSPAAKSSAMPFTDVKSGSYYYDAVLWAVENGITKGTSATEFSPDQNCSRAQIVTFLWRSEKSPAAGTVNPFTDVKSDAYYADAVLWAVKEDVTKGTTSTTFSPDDNCTRAQIVTFIYRALAE